MHKVQKIFISLFISLLCIIPTEAQSRVITLGDIEGSERIFEHFLETHSEFIIEKNGEFELKKGVKLIIGGDICDKGPNCLKLLRKILKLKKKYSKQVVLLAGNRDIQKLYPFIENLKGSNVDKIARSLQGPSSMEIVENIRLELEEERQRPVSFKEAITEMIEQVRNQSGLFRQYLELAEVAHYSKKYRALSLHGALTEENLKTMEFSKNHNGRIIVGVNTWYQETLHRALSGDLKAGQKLLDISSAEKATPKYNNASPIYARNNPHNSMKITTYSPNMVRFLKWLGVDFVLNFHTPVSGYPVVIKHPQNIHTIISHPSAGDHQTTKTIVSEKGVRLIKNMSLPKVHIDMTISRHQTESLIGRHLPDGRIIIGFDNIASRYLAFDTVLEDGKFKNIITKINKSKILSLLQAGSCEALQAAAPQ